jgi:hypothetical protein
MDDYGLILGNLAASLVGLIFVLCAPVGANYRTAKWLLSADWACTLLFYAFQALSAKIGLSEGDAVPVLSLANSLGTMFLLMFGMQLYGWIERWWLAAASVTAPTLTATVVDTSFAVLYGSEIYSYIVLTLVAFRFRTTHRTTMFLLLFYANLQLPTCLCGRELVQISVLLIAAKISLIGAYYSMLGVRELTGLECHYCHNKIRTILDGDFCDLCGQPVHRRCRQSHVDGRCARVRPRGRATDS